MKYDIEYKEYQQRLEQKKKDQLRMAEMDKHRQKMINDLNLREEMVMKQRQNEMYKNHHYHITQQRIKEEMERFRKELRNEENNRINKKLKEFERKKKDEKLKKRSLMIKLDKTQCHKPYSLKELESIFRSYGKIEDIHMNKQSKNKYGGAEIVFTKSKYVQNAFNDQKTLKKEFYLILIDNNRKNGSSKNNSLENKWRNFVNKRQKQYDYNQYNQYQAFVWNKVDQFINDNNACDKDNEETSASV